MLTSPETQSMLMALVSCFVFGGCCGVAEKMRSKTTAAICVYEFCAAFIYSACLGTVISVFYYHWYGKDGALFAVGISGGIGLGGLKLTDFLISCIGAGGVSITLSPNNTREPGHESRKDSNNEECQK